ncbi:MAG: hypothetical protein ABSE46_08095 [Terracidiphilus sp.]
MKFAVWTFVFAFGVSTAAVAKAAPPPGTGPIPLQKTQLPPMKSEPAPEVDPSFAIAGISLLAGTLVVVRSRFRK